MFLNQRFKVTVIENMTVHRGTWHWDTKQAEKRFEEDRRALNHVVFMHYISCDWVIWDVTLKQYWKAFNLKTKTTEKEKFNISYLFDDILTTLKTEFRGIHPPLHPKWFPVNGIMSKECRRFLFPYISAFVRLWMGLFSPCSLSTGSGFMFICWGRVACIHVRSALSVSIFFF